MQSAPRWTIGLVGAMVGVLGVTIPGLADAPARRILAGRVLHALSGEPVAGALVTVLAHGESARTAHDGSFAIGTVPSGAFVIEVSADGFLPRRLELSASVLAAATVLDITLDPLLHFTEAVSVRGDARSSFEQPLSVSSLAGQELSSRLEGTLGASLRSQPGVAERSSGPGASRPVIRGLDGDRVHILEDTQGTGDLSSQSADHGVNVNPAMAARIEIVRGPATLLYGANAVGGVVNIVTNTIPTTETSAGGPLSRGLVTVEGGSAASEVGITGATGWRLGRLAMRAAGSGRRSGDVRTPAGRVANTSTTKGMGVIGASLLGRDGYLGASYGYDGERYGLPAATGSDFVALTPRRHSVSVRSERRAAQGWLRSSRFALAHRNYRHDELELGEVGTTFRNRHTEASTMFGYDAARAGTGSFGAAGTWRTFSATGEEALSPPVDQRSFAAFGFHEIRLPKLTLQGGARLESTRYRPDGGLRARAFLDASWSAGVVFAPSAATSLALTLAHAGRRPALEELYFNGLHIGNFAFEIGNPDLASERAIGLDAAWRWRLAKVAGEVTAFRNAIAGYIFREPTGEVDEGYPVVRFIGRDGILTGVESRVEVTVTSQWSLQGAIDVTRGSLADSGEALPRIPPARGRLAVRYQRNAWQSGVEVERLARQARVYPGETPTDGATLLRLHTTWSFMRGGGLHTLSARVDNATNRLYRNHLSYQKQVFPEAGRNAKLVYTVAF
jgi:iron complex outermembrane receptor protein